MATIPTTSKVSVSADEENRTNYETDLCAENTDDEIYADTSTWATADKKKLQHMTKLKPRISMCFWRGSLHSNHFEEKNI